MAVAAVAQESSGLKGPLASRPGFNLQLHGRSSIGAAAGAQFQSLCFWIIFLETGQFLFQISPHCDMTIYFQRCCHAITMLPLPSLSTIHMIVT